MERRLSSSRKRSSSPATSAATHSTAAKKVDDFPNGPLVILWGSQTGTAEGFGETLAREARQRGFKARSIDLEDYEPDELAEEELATCGLQLNRVGLIFPTNETSNSSHD